MQRVKTAYIGGGSGFIGHWMGRRLKSEGYWVRCVDIKPYEFGDYDFCDEFILGDLRDSKIVESTLRLNTIKKYSYHPIPFEELDYFDEVYTFACLMGGAGFVFTGDHDGEIMHDSALININMAEALRKQNFKGKLFYSSSACMYPQELQTEEIFDAVNGWDKNSFSLKESDAYPANPDSEYGWEKLFSERLFLAYKRNYGLNVRIARFHNIFGPEGTYKGGKEKAPAALCRKVALSNGEVEIWGDGEQTRSFLYIDECIEGVRRLMESEFTGPVNIGSDEMISINDLALMIGLIAGKRINLKHIEGPQGVRGRNSDNTLIEKELGWRPSQPLKDGIEKTYFWIKSQYE